jgi:hypothetical protein
VGEIDSRHSKLLSSGDEEDNDTDRPGIMVTETEKRTGTISLRIVAGLVLDEKTISAEDMEDSPALGTKLYTECIAGTARVEAM